MSNFAQYSKENTPPFSKFLYVFVLYQTVYNKTFPISCLFYLLKNVTFYPFDTKDLDL